MAEQNDLDKAAEEYQKANGGPSTQTATSVSNTPATTIKPSHLDAAADEYNNRKKEESVSSHPGPLNRFTTSAVGLPEGETSSQFWEATKEEVRHPIQTIVRGVENLNPLPAMRNAYVAGVNRTQEPGIVNKLTGTGEVLESAFPIIGPGIVSAQEKGRHGDVAGMVGASVQPSILAAGLTKYGPSSPELAEKTQNVVTAPIRIGFRSAEEAVNAKIGKAINPLKAMNPADEAVAAPRIKIPGRDFGLIPKSKYANPAVIPPVKTTPFPSYPVTSAERLPGVPGGELLPGGELRMGPPEGYYINGFGELVKNPPAVKIGPDGGGPSLLPIVRDPTRGDMYDLEHAKTPKLTVDTGKSIPSPITRAGTIAPAAQHQGKDETKAEEPAVQVPTKTPPTPPSGPASTGPKAGQPGYRGTPQKVGNEIHYTADILEAEYGVGNVKALPDGRFAYYDGKNWRLAGKK